MPKNRQNAKKKKATRIYFLQHFQSLSMWNLLCDHSHYRSKIATFINYTTRPYGPAISRIAPPALQPHPSGEIPLQLAVHTAAPTYIWGDCAHLNALLTVFASLYVCLFSTYSSKGI
jgi:hypothetical protein